MRQHTSVTIVALLSAGLFLTGCQLFDSSTRQPAPRSASVMSMWELYRHCQSSGDVETVLSAAKQLQQSADTHVVPEAEQLLYAVVLSYPESDYTFYVAQAKVWIEELHRPGTPDALIHPISTF